MKRLQIYYPEDLLSDLRLYAKNNGIPLAEALRRASLEFAHKPNVKKLITNLKKQSQKKMEKNHPVMNLYGILKGGLTDASRTIDEIYNE